MVGLGDDYQFVSKDYRMAPQWFEKAVAAPRAREWYENAVAIGYMTAKLSLKRLEAAEQGSEAK